MSDASPLNTSMRRRGLMFVLSSPSGAGKSTLSRLLTERDQSIALSVSVTTRERRPSEVDGVHYSFVTKRAFERMRESADLLESAEVHGNFYGTPREPVEQALAKGRDVLFDIDYQGTIQLYEKMPADVVGVFILPPTAAELKHRLERRAEDASGIITRRLSNARIEIAEWGRYDYVLVNEDLNQTFLAIQHILAAERMRRSRQLDLEATVARLDKELGDLLS